MEIKNRLAALLDKNILNIWNIISEVRLRTDLPARYRSLDGSEFCGPSTDANLLRKIVHNLMENSLYSCEEELKQGYFTAEGGCRVGVCGRMNLLNGYIANISSIGSVCIRIPHEKKGCADKLLAYSGKNILILSAPGLGKTTLLRDLIRHSSDSGMNVAVADERGEIAACHEGIPTLDLGLRTDVMDGCPKYLAIPMLIRACTPDYIAVDEIGSEDDARVLSDAARCGVKILATAHASSIVDLNKRRHIAQLLNEGIFEYAVCLSQHPGNISQIHNLTNGE